MLDEDTKREISRIHDELTSISHAVQDIQRTVNQIGTVVFTFAWVVCLVAIPILILFAFKLVRDFFHLVM